MIMYFNRSTGELLVGSDYRDQAELEKLIAKRDPAKWERINPLGFLYVKALDKGHLDITTIPDDRML